MQSPFIHPSLLLTLSPSPTRSLTLSLAHPLPLSFSTTIASSFRILSADLPHSLIFRPSLCSGFDPFSTPVYLADALSRGHPTRNTYNMYPPSSFSFSHPLFRAVTHTHIPSFSFSLSLSLFKLIYPYEHAVSMCILNFKFKNLPYESFPA